MKQLIEDLISAMEYHVEQTRPIHSTTVALQAAREALKAMPTPLVCDCNQGQVCHVCDPITPPAQPAPVQDLPFGVGGGLVAIKTLLSRDPCVHANTAIEMIDAILKEHSAAQPAPVQHFNHTSAANSALRDAQNRSYQIAKLSQPAPVQEPVARVSLQWLAEMILSDCGHSSNYTPLLDRVKARIEQWERANSAPTPPAAQPAVPDAFGTREGEHPQYIEGWNDCRAEMLKGMKP